MTDMPTLRSRRLGSELRRLREEKGLTLQDAAHQLMCTQGKISHIERGKRGIRPVDLKLILDLYEVEDTEMRADFQRLGRQLHQVDWWDTRTPLLHDALRDYLMLETDSSIKREYESMVLPGLLQTKEYMKEIIYPKYPEDLADSMIETRLERGNRLDDTHGFALRAVIDEAAIRRIPGSTSVVVEQVERLLHEGERSNVTIQVLPVDAHVPIDQIVPFSIFTLAGSEMMEVVWLEHMAGSTLLEQGEDIALFSKTWESLMAAAMSPAQTRTYLKQLIKDQ